MPATPQKSTSHRWKRPAGQQICLWLEHAPQQPHPQRGGKNEVEERPGEALTTGGDEMTPGELTGKWREKKWTATNTVPLPEHLGERGVAVI